MTRIKPAIIRSTMRNLVVCLIITAIAAAPQQPPAAPGARSFATRCSVCHGGNGTGNERAPGILRFVGASSDDQIAALIRKGVNAMPPHNIPDAEMKDLVAFLHTLTPPARGGRGGFGPPRTATVKLPDGRSLEGTVRNESGFDMQLQTADGKIYRLVRD